MKMIGVLAAGVLDRAIKRSRGAVSLGLINEGDARKIEQVETKPNGVAARELESVRSNNRPHHTRPLASPSDTGR